MRKKGHFYYWTCNSVLFYVVNSFIRKQLAHGGISQYFFLDHFSSSFLRQKWCQISVRIFCVLSGTRNLQCYRTGVFWFCHNQTKKDVEKSCLPNWFKLHWTKQKPSWIHNIYEVAINGPEGLTLTYIPMSVNTINKKYTICIYRIWRYKTQNLWLSSQQTDQE